MCQLSVVEECLLFEKFNEDAHETVHALSQNVPTGLSNKPVNAAKKLIIEYTSTYLGEKGNDCIR